MFLWEIKEEGTKEFWSVCDYYNDQHGSKKVRSGDKRNGRRN